MDPVIVAQPSLLCLSFFQHRPGQAWNLSDACSPCTAPDLTTLTFARLPCRAVERRSASALAVQKPYGQPGRSSLEQQQHQIRSSGW